MTQPHPTPWKTVVCGKGADSVIIYDANDVLVETVYSIGGVSTVRDAKALADLIVNAVNLYEPAAPALAPPPQPSCCCSWGAAIGNRGFKGGGEYPEFDCADCPVHKQGLGPTDHRCKRHKRAMTP